MGNTLDKLSSLNERQKTKQRQNAAAEAALSEMKGKLTKEEVEYMTLDKEGTTAMTAEQIAESVLAADKASLATQKYLETIGAQFEASATGVTNRIALMAAGKIPASYRDMAELYRTLSRVTQQLNAIKLKAKKYILDDPTAGSSFMVGDVSYEVGHKAYKRFDTKT